MRTKQISLFMLLHAMPLGKEFKYPVDPRTMWELGALTTLAVRNPQIAFDPPNT